MKSENNFSALIKMHIDVYNALEKTDLKNIKKWQSYEGFWKTVCEK